MARCFSTNSTSLISYIYDICYIVLAQNRKHISFLKWHRQECIVSGLKCDSNIYAPSLNPDELKIWVSVCSVCQEFDIYWRGSYYMAQKDTYHFDTIDFESYHSQRFIMKRMICHCGLSYKFIMPLCHHPRNHHQNILRTMITLEDNKIMMINHFMKCVTHEVSRSYLSKSECHEQGVPIYKFCIEH